MKGDNHTVLSDLPTSSIDPPTTPGTTSVLGVITGREVDVVGVSVALKTVEVTETCTEVGAMLPPVIAVWANRSVTYGS